MSRTPKALRDFMPTLKRNGYVKVRTTGSHYVFMNRDTHRIMVVNIGLKYCVKEKLIKQYDLQ